MSTSILNSVNGDDALIRTYTVAQVAEDVLQVSHATVRRLVVTGLLPCRRVGVGVTRAGVLRFTAADVSEYLRRVRDVGPFP